ncbi:MAG: DUF1810 domain-containing protein [Acidobacteria bacterium]|nr:DUF1810 domain-containing protein [Acidobacteriota bacterium]
MAHCDLERFVIAQEPVMGAVLGELRAGRKRTHWMWFVFPQVAGLGLSEMSRRYAIASREEAAAYLAHPVLGPRLAECTELVNAANEPLEHVLGGVDAMKFHSSMTLFAAVAGPDSLFARTLARHFAGRPDQPTLDRLGGVPG